MFHHGRVGGQNTTKLIYLTGRVGGQEGAGKMYTIMFHPQNTTKLIYLTGRPGGRGMGTL